MKDEDAAVTILRMLEELPFYEDERRALQAAVVALHERAMRNAQKQA